MGGRFRNSLDLAKSSWSLLRSDKQLIWLPVISTIATLVAIATFALPVIALSNMSGGSFQPLAIAVGVLGYFVLAYITIFFNAALVFAADELMRGGKPTIGTAIAGARSRAHRILPWAIVSAIVSVILRMIEERGGIIGRIGGMIAGIAWSLVTFLVLPILVLEGIGVRDALKRSAKLFKGTWGEQVIANAGIFIVGFVALIPALLVGFLGVASGTLFVAVPLVGIAVIYGAVVLAVTAALTGVFQTALYHYAANGMPPAAFAESELRGAFKPRQQQGFRGFV
ncbi:MAG TPA: DUF6159 family protein [Acidimicrobiia bacterium]|jgi:hypothetical protein